jgi:hypothetical protein
MVIDRYTKAVLTVIALCLIWLCLRDSAPVPEAFATPTDRGDEVVKVQLVSIDESPTLRWESIPVELP